MRKAGVIIALVAATSLAALGALAYKIRSDQRQESIQSDQQDLHAYRHALAKSMTRLQIYNSIKERIEQDPSYVHEGEPIFYGLGQPLDPQGTSSTMFVMRERYDASNIGALTQKIEGERADSSRYASIIRDIKGYIREAGAEPDTTLMGKVGI